MTLPDHRFAHVYSSPVLFGSGAIIRKYLGMPEDHVLPLTVPHGVDAHLLRVDLDRHSHEPLYLALRDDIAARMSSLKNILKFPHPWLLLDFQDDDAPGSGTLFLGPPPSLAIFEAFYAQIGSGDFPRPWGILLKERGLREADWQWWQDRGFQTHSAGAVYDQQFYHNLRAILQRYALIVSPNLSSAVVFATSLGKPALPLPDVEMALIETSDILEMQDFDDTEGKARRVWRELLSGDPARSRPVALELLGHGYLAPREELLERYRAALAAADRNVHLHPLRPGLLQKLLEWLIRRGLPAHKFFPYPLRRIGAMMRRKRVTIIEGSDLAHYGIAGSSGKYRIRVVRSGDVAGKPGAAVRSGEGAAAPASCATEPGHDDR